MPPGHLIITWRENGELKHHDEAFTPTGTWQTMRASIAAKPGETIQISVYQMTCQVWLKRAVWRLANGEVSAPMMPGPSGILDQPGMLRLTSYGPGGLLTKFPDTSEPAQLELELLLQVDMNTVNAAAVMAKARLDASRRSAQGK